MSHAALELQTAIVAVLKGDATLAAMLGPDGVRDGAARAASFPYVEIGELTSRDVGAREWQGVEHRLSVIAWSRAGGRTEALNIMEQISVITDGVLPVLGSFRLVSLTRIEARVTRGRDGRSWRGALVFRALTEPDN